LRNKELSLMRKHRFVFPSVTFAILGALGFLPNPPAHGTEIRVHADSVMQKASPEVFGNSVIFDGGTMGFNEWVSNQAEYDEAERTWNHYLSYLSELGPTVLRYPGGLTANTFYWKDGIGPFTQRNPNYSGRGIPQTFGTDEFLRYCEELGAKAIFVVNVSKTGTRPGTFQDAADWVEYCNAPDNGSNPGGGTDWAARRASNGHKEPYGVKYWELGNEETYPGFEDYAQRVNAYSAAMKAIDPTIETGVISSGAGLDPIYDQQGWLDYRTMMLERAGDSFDFWIQHLHTPGTNGIANGFSMVREGASLEVSFSVDRAGDYWFEVPAEGNCKSLQCPRLSLEVDGENLGGWTVALYSVLRSRLFTLERGEHRLRLEADSLANGARITVRQQVDLFQVGQEEPMWVDLKKSSAWYHALFGGWPVSEEVYRAGRPYAGGKPVYYTEVSTNYKEASPPSFSKVCYLREMLNTGCVYHFLLRNGVPLANYWLLFHERAGLGVLEGVAYAGDALEGGRPDPHKRPVFHLLEAYRCNVLDWVVSTEVLDPPGFPVGPQTGITLGYSNRDFEVSYLQGLATISDTGDRLSLFVINLHPDEDIQAPVVLEGFTRKTSVKVLTITGPSPSASNEPEDCPSGDCVTTRQQDLQIGANPFSYRFPRHSVTVFVFSRTGSDQQAPRFPTGLAGIAGDGRVFLTWDENPEGDLKGYNLYRSRRPDGPHRNRVNTEPIDSPEYLDPGVDNDVTYTYAITAVDRSGNESDFSDAILLTPLAGLGDPGSGGTGGGVCTLSEGSSGDPTCSDGLDNDCDGSADSADCDCSYAGCANAEAATYGSGSVTGSGVSNEFILLFIPVGAVLLLKALGRRRR
jgi:alpha-L-arabinofuranosidase